MKFIVADTRSHSNFSFFFDCVWYHFLKSTCFKTSLLNKVLQVPKCLACLSTWVPKWPSRSRVPICLSAQMSWVLWVPRVPESPSVSWVLKCPWSAIWVSSFPLSVLRVKKVCNITGNRLVNCFTEFFKNFSEYIFYIAFVVLFFLGNKICKFYQALLVRCNHWKGFQNLP